VKFRTTTGRVVEVLLRDLRDRRARTTRQITTRGEQSIEAGREVTLRASGCVAYAKSQPCPHCGVTFSVHLRSVEAPNYVELIEEEAPAP